MSIFSYKTKEEVILFTNNWCAQYIEKTNAKSILIPSGNTVIPLYQLWEKQKPNFLKNIEFLQIDDVITGESKGLFRKFLNEHLPSFQSQIRWIENDYVQADLSIVGLGLNGHVGFHEPGLAASFKMGCVNLSKTTCDNLKLIYPTWGVTYGIGAVANCKRSLMVAWGASKKEVLSKLILKDQRLPATSLMHQSNFDLVYEKVE